MGKSEKKDLEHGGDVKRRGTGSSRSGAIWRGGLCSAAWCWAGGKLEKLADVTNRMAMPCPDGCGQGGPSRSLMLLGDASRQQQQGDAGGEPQSQRWG